MNYKYQKPTPKPTCPLLDNEIVKIRTYHPMQYDESAKIPKTIFNQIFNDEDDYDAYDWDEDEEDYSSHRHPNDYDDCDWDENEEDY